MAAGVNTFQMMVGNQICTVIAPETPLQVTWTPPTGSDLVFRVTLTWNEATSDPDLHTWSPNLAGHSSWHNKSITGAVEVPAGAVERAPPGGCARAPADRTRLPGRRADRAAPLAFSYDRERLWA